MYGSSTENVVLWRNFCGSFETFDQHVFKKKLDILKMFFLVKWLITRTSIFFSFSKLANI